MTYDTWLRRGAVRLEDAGIATARLDSLILLEDAIGQDRAWLLAHPEEQLTPKQHKLLDVQIKRRIAHEPLAYIRGKTEFYGREFMISKDTLEPRPETETMIDLAKGLRLKAPRIADIGAGCGAIGLTLALEIPDSQVDLYEISTSAIAIARQNLQKFDSVNVHIYKNDLLEAVTASYDLIVANLPYVPDSHTINQAAMHEPALAIFGGKDGLNLYRQLFEQLAAIQPRYVLTESLPFQHERLTTIATSNSYELLKTDDFIQLYRAIRPGKLRA